MEEERAQELGQIGSKEDQGIYRKYVGLILMLQESLENSKKSESRFFYYWVNKINM